jgi:hypothetical protein
MNYLLVQNKQMVILGPITWRQRFIQTEINDLIDDGELTIDYTVPATEQGYINIGDGFEIFPVELTTPAFDPIYEELSGPFWTYENNTAYGSYTVVQLSIERIKGHLKQVVSAERYRKQNLGTTVAIANTTFSVSTDTNTINSLLSLANTTGTDTINYKSPNGFISLTGADIQNIVNQIHDYIQTQFNWEKTTNETIDVTNDITLLQAIEIVEPITPRGV